MRKRALTPAMAVLGWVGCGELLRRDLALGLRGLGETLCEGFLRGGIQFL